MSSKTRFVTEALICPNRPPQGEGLDVFTLMLQFSPDKEHWRYHDVFIPARLRPLLSSPKLACVHLEELTRGGLLSSLIPGEPAYLLTGLSLKDGTWHAEFPKPLVRARRALGAAALLACGAGAFLLSSGWAWPGALLMVLSSHLATMYLAVPEPFDAKTHLKTDLDY